MKEELYRQALSSFNNGDYEKALDILKQGESQLSSIQEKLLLEQCKKQITEQYYYFINDSIRQEDYFTARALKEKHKVKYGANPRIDNIAIPQKKIETPSLPSYEPDGGDGSAMSTRLWAIIGGIVIIGIIGFLYWQYSNDVDPYQDNVTFVQDEIKSENYEEKSEAIISRLTGEYGGKISVLHTYPELSKYCAFRLIENETEYLLIYDLEQEVLKRFETINLQTINAGKLFLAYYSLSMNEDNDKILIRGDNGANGIGSTEYILEIDPSSWEIREICSGRHIEKDGDNYVASIIIMTKWNTHPLDSEYASIDVYYDSSGKLIPLPGKGDVLSLTGKIDNKYAITMSISIQTNGIYGTYYYDKYGSNNKLYLYGGVSENKDIVLLEFDDAARPTGIFKGRFTSKSLEGTFTNNAGVEMPFELYPVVDSSSDSNKSQSSANASTNAYIPDRDAEFPGGMVGLGQYITENLQYPADAKAKGISGNVRVSYIIDKDGSITDVKVIESVDPDLDREAVRLISSMPKWKPGIRQSKFVKMRTSTEIRFELE